eukprot:4708816-Ditylum_brightwellii.AAC.1
METPYLGDLETYCLIPFKRHDIGKVQVMVAVPSSTQNRMLVVRTLGHNSLDGLISARYSGNGGREPLHVRCKVGDIPIQSVKIKLKGVGGVTY